MTHHPPPTAAYTVRATPRPALVIELGNGYHIVQDHPAFSVQYDCPAGTWCQLGTDQLPPGAQFSNANFYCAASQYGVISTPITPVCSPSSNRSLIIYFFNDSGTDIPLGTPFTLETHAEGI